MCESVHARARVYVCVLHPYVFNQQIFKRLTLCIRETPEQVLFQTVYTCKGKNDHQTKEYTFQKKKDNLTPLDMYNRLSQVHCIKPKERIH